MSLFDFLKPKTAWSDFRERARCLNCEEIHIASKLTICPLCGFKRLNLVIARYKYNYGLVPSDYAQPLEWELAKENL